MEHGYSFFISADQWNQWSKNCAIDNIPKSFLRVVVCSWSLNVVLLLSSVLPSSRRRVMPAQAGIQRRRGRASSGGADDGLDSRL
ncbi:MAG: hypothetical protein WED34_00695, partial [Planctomycetales bacterium]